MITWSRGGCYKAVHKKNRKKSSGRLLHENSKKELSLKLSTELCGNKGFKLLNRKKNFPFAGQRVYITKTFETLTSLSIPMADRSDLQGQSHRGNTNAKREPTSPSDSHNIQCDEEEVTALKSRTFLSGYPGEVENAEVTI